MIENDMIPELLQLENFPQQADCHQKSL